MSQNSPEDLTTKTPISKLACWSLPLLDLALSLAYIPSAIYEFFTKRGNDSFSTALFSKFWVGIAEGADAECAPEKRHVITGCRGTVVEIGPGLGPSIQYFDKKKVKRVYAIEPNRELCKDLRKKAEGMGWGEDRYIILNCGIEDEEELRKAGVPVDGGVDTVISIQVLCTVPDPKGVLRSIYRCLKPGGELRLLKHIQSNDKATQRVQAFYDYFWHIPFGGCNLSRPTQKWLLDSEFMGFGRGGGWENVELEKIKGESIWDTLPKVWGRLVKRA